MEPHNENHSNSELTTTINNDFSDLNCKEPIPIFKTEGPEVDKLKEQSQCTVDSNILAEFKNEKDVHSLSTYSDHDLVHNGKGPQNIERNASTVKPRNSREVTNDINPMHQSAYDSHVPKQKVAIDIEESSKLCETIVENGPVNEGRTQLEIMDIKLGEILHKSIDDASKRKMVKLTVRDSSFENNPSSLNSMDFGDIFDDTIFKIKSTVKTIPQLLEYLKESYSDDDIHKVVDDVIGHIKAHVDPSTRDIIVAMAEVDMNKSMTINGKYVN